MTDHDKHVGAYWAWRKANPLCRAGASPVTLLLLAALAGSCTAVVLAALIP